MDNIYYIALLHDIAKANFYEAYYRNVKNEETGKWEQQLDYRMRPDEDRFIYGNHEQNSEYMARRFFPLNLRMSTAILHHHGGTSWDSAKDEIPAVYSRFPLATMLHMADLAATFMYDKNN